MPDDSNKPNLSHTSTIAEFVYVQPGYTIPTSADRAAPHIVGFYRISSAANQISRATANAVAVRVGVGRWETHMGAQWAPVVKTGERPNGTEWDYAAPEGHYHVFATLKCTLCDAQLDPNCIRDDYQASFRDTNNYICTACFTLSHRVFDVVTSGWIERDQAAWNVDLRRFANVRWARDNWWHWTRDDQWHNSPYDADSESYDDSDGSGHNPIMGYHTNSLEYVNYDASALQAGKLMYGVELEMEPKDGEEHTQLRMAHALGGPSTADYILTRDGSLNHGVELVSAPRSLLEHQRGGVWPAVHKAVAGIAMSGAGTTRCGMHVHINRRALSPLTLGKLLVFFNDDEMNHYIQLIAQRNSNGYSRKKDKGITSALYQNDDRYERLNMSSRTRTVEVRIFRGNLKPQRILKNIEFVDAAVNYCKQCRMRDAKDWLAFAEWLRPKTSIYPNLIAFLKEKRVLGFAGHEFSRSVMELASTGTED